MPYQFQTTCVSHPRVEDLYEMEEEARPITFRTALKHLGRELLEQTFPDYAWRRGQKGLRMAKDWHIQYSKSFFCGVPCIDVDHSAIDHIFTKTNYAN